MKAPSGMPSTEATDQPRKMKVMARPRCSVGTSWPTQAAACGVKIADGTSASTRSGSSQAKSGASAQAKCTSADQHMDSASSRRRSQPPSSAANSGAPKHSSRAPVEISWPAAATDTASEALISLSVPGTTITPVPMTKLPNSSAQRTGGMAAFSA